MWVGVGVGSRVRVMVRLVGSHLVGLLAGVWGVLDVVWLWVMGYWYDKR